MRELLDELKDIPGMVGACLFSSRSGLLESNLPGIFKPDTLTAISNQLVGLYSAGQSNFEDLTDVSLHYDEFIVMARELDNDLLISAVCDATLNVNLLRISLNLLEKKLKSGVIDDELGDGVVALPPLSDEQAPEKQAIDPDLEIVFDHLRSLLAKVMGPMAGFIFDEVYGNWKDLGTVEASRVDTLISFLDQEIADPEKIERYRTLIEPVLADLRNR